MVLSTDTQLNRLGKLILFQQACQGQNYGKLLREIAFNMNRTGGIWVIF